MFKFFTLAFFAFFVSGTDAYSQSDPFTHCPETDAKCVGRVLLGAIVANTSNNGGVIQHCECRVHRIENGRGDCTQTFYYDAYLVKKMAGNSADATQTLTTKFALVGTYCNDYPPDLYASQKAEATCIEKMNTLPQCQ